MPIATRRCGPWRMSMIRLLNTLGRSTGLAAWTLLASLPAMVAFAGDAAESNSWVPNAPIEASHHGLFNGRRMDYRSVVEPIAVTDASGKFGATLVNIAYLASG